VGDAVKVPEEVAELRRRAEGHRNDARASREMAMVSDALAEDLEGQAREIEIEAGTRRRVPA